MLNPHQKPEEQLKKRARQYMEKLSVPTKTKSFFTDTFNEFLRGESIVLTRNEKRRLFQTVTQEIFNDILADL